MYILTSVILVAAGITYTPDQSCRVCPPESRLRYEEQLYIKTAPSKEECYKQMESLVENNRVKSAKCEEK